MPKHLKNTEGLTPGALKIVNTPTCELRHFLKNSQPSDIVAAHLAMRRENIFPAKQRVITEFVAGRARGAFTNHEVTHLKDKMRSSWYAKFADEWDAICRKLKATRKKGDQP